jgi:predicted Rossmann fold flavoprotein
MNTDILIIGGGPAGLFCALRAAAGGLSATVLEKNPRPGKKLLVTGSGQCNLTNTAPIEMFLKAYGDKGRFVKPALMEFPNTSLMEFFSTRGVSLEERHKGKVFPRSGRAGDILELLMNQCRQAGVDIRCNRTVTTLSREGTGFRATAGGENHSARFVLVSCGGASWPGTGSTGDGYALVAALGHRIVVPHPSLTPVYPSAFDASSCSGIALSDTPVTLWRGGKKIGGRIGDLLFTHQGLSGPGILDFSRDFQPGDEIRLQLVRTTDREQIEKDIISVCNNSPRKSLKNLLSGFNLPETLILVVLKRCGIDPETTGAAFDKSSRRILAEALYGLRYIIRETGGFDEAMATAGGVDTAEVKSKTMESRVVPGLYFAGEVLDVDGDTGGFNLQFAFSSGALAAEGMRHRNLEEL